jgi:hypothetical protein
MQWPVIRPSSPFPHFRLSSPNSLAKTQQTQFRLGNPSPHIRHHHSSISEGISHYRQNLYLVGGLSPLALKAIGVARRAAAAGWSRRNGSIFKNHSSYIWTSRIRALGTRRFCRFATKIPPFSCCFSGLNGIGRGESQVIVVNGFHI